MIFFGPFSSSDLYPAVVKALQSVHGSLALSDPLLSEQLQRLLALVSLLTQVTHTAGCHQELQTAMLRYKQVTPDCYLACPDLPSISFSLLFTALVVMIAPLLHPCRGLM